MFSALRERKHKGKFILFFFFKEKIQSLVTGSLVARWLPRAGKSSTGWIMSLGFMVFFFFFSHWLLCQPLLSLGLGPLRIPRSLSQFQHHMQPKHKAAKKRDSDLSYSLGVRKKFLESLQISPPTFLFRINSCAQCGINIFRRVLNLALT